VGALAVLGIFGFLASRAFRAAFAEEDAYRSCLGMGMAFLLSLEVLVNAAVVAGVIPATGIVLPFFSAGGSSLISTAISCGIIYNLSARAPSSSRASEGASAFSTAGAGNV
jgi:cell division protein FtsW